jgi:hypothetical protein
MKDPWLTAKVGDILIWEDDTSTTGCTYRKVIVKKSLGDRKFIIDDLATNGNRLLKTGIQSAPIDTHWRISEASKVTEILTKYK